MSTWSALTLRRITFQQRLAVKSDRRLPSTRPPTPRSIVSVTGHCTTTTTTTTTTAITTTPVIVTTRLTPFTSATPWWHDQTRSVQALRLLRLVRENYYHLDYLLSTSLLHFLVNRRRPPSVCSASVHVLCFLHFVETQCFSFSLLTSLVFFSAPLFIDSSHFHFLILTTAIYSTQ